MSSYGKRSLGDVIEGQEGVGGVVGSSDDDQLVAPEQQAEVVGALPSASVKVKSWRLVLAPWSAEQCVTLRRFGVCESYTSLFGLRSDERQLEFFVTCKVARRASWMAANVLNGDWQPTVGPKTNDERRALLAQYEEGSDRSVQGRRIPEATATAFHAEPMPALDSELPPELLLPTTSLLPQLQHSLSSQQPETPAVTTSMAVQTPEEQPRLEQATFEQPSAEEVEALLVKRRRLDDELAIKNIEIEQLEYVRSRVRNQILAIDYKIALAQPDSDQWATYRRSQVTIPYIESRLSRILYCAYHRCFHGQDCFGNSQRFARPERRYCMAFVNEQLRDTIGPSMVMSDPNEVYRMARIMRIRVIAHD